VVGVVDFGIFRDRADGQRLRGENREGEGRSPYGGVSYGQLSREGGSPERDSPSARSRPTSQTDEPGPRHIHDGGVRALRLLPRGQGLGYEQPREKGSLLHLQQGLRRIRQRAGAVLTFVDVRTIFDAKEPTEDNIHPAPKDLLAWFRHHPRLDISNPVPTTVGGVPAERFDVSVTSLAEERLDECPDCLPVFGLRYEEPISVVKGFDQLIVLVEGSGGETVAIILYAPPDRFDEYLSKAQGVLNTVSWGNA
jgi:hypothetical protein